jgi:hypothetical protein
MGRRMDAAEYRAKAREFVASAKQHLEELERKQADEPPESN